MIRKSTRFLRWFGIFLVVLCVGFNFFAYRHAYGMMHFSRAGMRTGQPERLTLAERAKVLLLGVNLPRPQSKDAPSRLNPATRAITIEEPHSAIKLGAWYCPGDPANPLVILFHGYASDKCGTIREASSFLSSGYSVLLVDFRGSGNSSESYTTIGYFEAEDVQAAVQYAQQHLAASKIVLYGQSMGASAVLRAIDHDHVHPDAVIVEAVFDELIKTVRHRFDAMGVPSFPGAELLAFWGGHQFGFDAFAHNPVEYARHVDCPVLFLHIAGDPRAQIEEGRRVFEAIPGPKVFHEFAGSRHEAAIAAHPVEWKETTAKFLSETFHLNQVAAGK